VYVCTQGPTGSSKETCTPELAQVSGRRNSAWSDRRAVGVALTQATGRRSPPAATLARGGCERGDCMASRSSSLPVWSRLGGADDGWASATRALGIDEEILPAGIGRKCLTSASPARPLASLSRAHEAPRHAMAIQYAAALSKRPASLYGMYSGLPGPYQRAPDRLPALPLVEGEEMVGGRTARRGQWSLPGGADKPPRPMLNWWATRGVGGFGSWGLGMHVTSRGRWHRRGS